MKTKQTNKQNKGFEATIIQKPNRKKIVQVIQFAPDGTVRVFTQVTDPWDNKLFHHLSPHYC